jgi:hypothetical protein
VARDHQGQGIGLRRLGTLEAAAPTQVRRSELAAGHKSSENLAMYERRYREVSGASTLPEWSSWSWARTAIERAPQLLNQSQRRQ